MDSSGAQTTSCSPRVETTTKYVVGEFQLCVLSFYLQRPVCHLSLLVPRCRPVARLQLLVWNHSSVLPVQQYTEHLAAVKAIAWSPHQHGLLASGGGTADRCIRFWNTLTGQPLQCTDTGSQVCNLAWSKHTNELVSHLSAFITPVIILNSTTYIKASPTPAFDTRMVCLKYFFTACFYITNEWREGFISSAGQHTWIFSKPNPCLEVPLAHPGGQTHGAFLQSPLPGQCLAVLMLS